MAKTNYKVCLKWCPRQTALILLIIGAIALTTKGLGYYRGPTTSKTLTFLPITNLEARKEELAEVIHKQLEFDPEISSITETSITFELENGEEYIDLENLIDLPGTFRNVFKTASPTAAPTFLNTTIRL